MPTIPSSLPQEQGIKAVALPCTCGQGEPQHLLGDTGCLRHLCPLSPTRFSSGKDKWDISNSTKQICRGKNRLFLPDSPPSEGTSLQLEACHMV